MIFLITFLLMLLSGSIFILGFYTITRGKKLVLPNGTEEIEKEIFGDWQLFWEDIIKYQKVFYSGKQLEDKLKILEQLKPEYKGYISLTKEKRSLVFNDSPMPEMIRDIEFSLNTNTLQKEEIVFLYDEFPVYRFSEWVRKITNCYVCLSSIGGTIFYWIITYFFPAIFQYSQNPILCKIVFWVIFCVSLSFVNKTIKEFFDID